MRSKLKIDVSARVLAELTVFARRLSQKNPYRRPLASTGFYDYSGREFPTQESAYQADLIALDYSIDEKDSIFRSKYRFAYL